MTTDLNASRAAIQRTLEEVRRELGEPLPASAEYWGGRKPELPYLHAARYCELMAARGLTAPSWPREYGGAGFSAHEARLLSEELRRAAMPLPLVGFGLSMIGPTLLRFGTEAQKQEHLPKIARGEIRWAQGYSEPNAGSDLASLQTSARLDGDEFVIDGQKVWTSYGEKADWMFALVRTDADGKKQEGITFLLLDLHQAGIEIRPIKLISGSSPFCETFFSEARAQLKDVVGGIGKGWAVAKALLGHERSMLGDVFGKSLGDRVQRTENPLVALAKRYLGEGELSDAQLRDRLTQVLMDEQCFALTMQRSAESARAGHAPGAESSILKIYGTELNQRREELMLSIHGPQCLGWEGPGFSEEELAQTRRWLRSRGNTIEGGTSEVQLNIIAKQVLGLPD